MGVYIKGVEMPTTCWFKRFDDCSLTRKKCKQYGGKENDCPIVEVPEPHGRLIDADTLPIKDLDSNGWLNAFGVAVEDLENAPAVIEAEK